MERTIGKYSRMIKSKVDSGANAGNIIEKIAMKNYLDIYLDIEEDIDVIAPKPYNDNTFISYPSGNKHSPQLWTPIPVNPYNMFTPDNGIDHFGYPVTNTIILNKLQRFYTNNGFHPGEVITNFNLKTAGRAWINSTVYSSTMNRKRMSEFSRSNHLVWFTSYHRKYVHK